MASEPPRFDAPTTQGSSWDDQCAQCASIRVLNKRGKIVFKASREMGYPTGQERSCRNRLADYFASVLLNSRVPLQ